MNKSYLYFAFLTFSFAAFLSACSDDGGDSIADRCKNGPSKACLVGEWRFDGIEGDDNTKCEGNLSIQENNKYIFEGGCGGPDYKIKASGNWNLDGKNIEINCIVDCAEDSSGGGTIDINSDGKSMSIESKTSRAAVSFYKTERVSRPKEKFTRK